MIGKNDTERLRDKLKSFGKLDNDQVDEAAIKSTEDAISKIDCLTCANCCKSVVTTFSDLDISKAAKSLAISKKQFVRKYLMFDGSEYVTITTPCPMLNEDNTCRIYEARPHACQSYPHTDRKHFNSRRHAHQANLEVCPISIFVIEKMAQLLQAD